jgi:hypothetical protein
MSTFLFMSVIALFLASLLAAGCIAVVISSVIVHYFPNSSLADFVRDLWFDTEETPDSIFNPIVGDCISTYRERK